VFKGTVVLDSSVSEKFQENTQIKNLLENLKEKYIHKPLPSLILLDSKADLDLRMNLLAVKSDSAEKFSAFESFGDTKKIIQARKLDQKDLTTALGSFEQIMDLLTLK